ncbi:hypothetical protein [Planctomycetes bacterium K23_9]|uniref:Secreted protein n=1 Tax=Stieleria marina TaxID=1930275 RepID=A0A517NT71_9BACT|nr:hypothetical protein K239x_22650 [Planctomycetes bacterium K23_9]
MKKIACLMLFCATVCFVLPGCGGSESSVVEAPQESGDGSAMEGIDDEAYNKAMNEAMKGQGGN